MAAKVIRGMFFVFFILFQVTINLKVLKTLYKFCKCPRGQPSLTAPGVTGGRQHIVSSIFISDIPTLTKNQLRIYIQWSYYNKHTGLDFKLQDDLPDSRCHFLRGTHRMFRFCQVLITNTSTLLLHQAKQCSENQALWDLGMD